MPSSWPRSSAASPPDSKSTASGRRVRFRSLWSSSALGFSSALFLLTGLNVATGAGLVVSAGALSWTTGTWLQERLDRRSEGRGRRERSLFGTRVLSGLGMGLANTAGLAVAFTYAPDGEEGTVSSSVLLSDFFFPATVIGIGGALVAFGAAQSGMRLSVVLASGLNFLLAALLLVSAYRLPGDSAKGRSGV